MGSVASIRKRLMRPPASPVFIVWALSARSLAGCVTTMIGTQRHILRHITQFASQVKPTVKDYQRIKRIGKKRFSAIHLVRRHGDAELCVLKTIAARDPKHKVQSQMNEAYLLRVLQHPNIVELKHFFFDGKCGVWILEYCGSGNLRTRISKSTARALQTTSKRRPFPELQVMDWFVQMAFAVGSLHDRKMIHEDIEPKNIFFTASGKVVKLGGLDGVDAFARGLDCFSRDVMPDIGPLHYVAPELIKLSCPTVANDVWALGCVLAEMLSLQVPFEGENVLSLCKKITEQQHTPIPDVYSAGVRSLVNLLLEKDPTKRPRVQDVLKHPFVQDHLKGFVQRYGETRRAMSTKTSRCKDANTREQESLQRVIATADSEIEKIGRQISRKAQKIAFLKKRLRDAREKRSKDVISLHNAVHSADEVYAIDQVIRIANKKIRRGFTQY